MLPKWAFGFWQSRERYKTSDELDRRGQRIPPPAHPDRRHRADWEYWGENPGGTPSFGIRCVSRTPPPLPACTKSTACGCWCRCGRDSVPRRPYTATWSAAGALPDERTWAGYKVFDAYDPAARDIVWNHFRTGLFDTGVDGWWMDATEPRSARDSPSASRRFGPNRPEKPIWGLSTAI
ncbi:MAG: TIM-barrel domain-containing protein [Alistipes communis]